MPTLDGYRWQQRYIAQLGCHKAALDFLGADVSFPWLYGGTGYAFVANVQAGIDPAGPTCWNWQAMFPLCRNLGYVVEGFSIERKAAGDDFPRLQREAWDMVRASIDAGTPVYGWELVPWIPDHGCIVGYEGDEYLYSSYAEGRAPWTKLGTGDVEVLQVYRVTRCEPAPVTRTVHAALAFALRAAEAPADLIYPGFIAGPAAFTYWAECLRVGTAQSHGQSYNAQCWHECRAEAVAFLRQAKAALPGVCDTALDDAARHYGDVRDALCNLVTMHPGHQEGQAWNSAPLQSDAGAVLMHQAAEAETRALASVRAIVEALGDP